MLGAIHEFYSSRISKADICISEQRELIVLQVKTVIGEVSWTVDHCLNVTIRMIILDETMNSIFPFPLWV